MKILLIDDHALFAKSLEIALDGFPEIDTFSNTQDVENIIEQLRREEPDIVLVDINLSNLNEEDGLILAKHILQIIPKQKIVILSGYDLPVYRHEAQKIGAKGFINKNVEPEELVLILADIEKGKSYFPKEEVIIEELTDSEKEILQLVASGMKRKEIASQLFLSERTVSNHLQHIFDKLQVSSTVEVVTKAIQMGYIAPMH